MSIIDSIERAVTFPVSRQRLWEAITRPDELSQWFGNEVELDLEEGGKFIMRWDNGDSTTGMVEFVDPPYRFGFRWKSSEIDTDDPLAPENSTLVTFILEDTDKGTRLLVRETGFAGLDESIREAARGENESGWTSELQDLVVYLGQEEAQ